MIRLWTVWTAHWFENCLLQPPATSNFLIQHTDMQMIMTEHEGDVVTTTTTCGLQIDIIWRNFIFRNQNVKQKGFVLLCDLAQNSVPPTLTSGSEEKLLVNGGFSKFISLHQKHDTTKACTHGLYEMWDLKWKDSILLVWLRDDSRPSPGLHWRICPWPIAIKATRNGFNLETSSREISSDWISLVFPTHFYLLMNLFSVIINFFERSGNFWKIFSSNSTWEHLRVQSPSVPLAQGNLVQRAYTSVLIHCLAGFASTFTNRMCAMLVLWWDTPSSVFFSLSYLLLDGPMWPEN